MITKTNFKKLLGSLGFTEKDNVLSKKINGETIKADFNNEKLIYPKNTKIEGDFTLNFSSNENFVVFECVHQLLLLGYKPEHLTLEPKWKLGHGASGGRADIVISDNDGKVFGIIECKTAGKEFDDAWSTGLQYPSQLFSYAQQEGSTQLICLYASDFINDKPEREYYVIPLVDNENLLKTISEESAATYIKATRYDELFNVWKETYHQEAFTKGFLEDDSLPFELGKKTYSIVDLAAISHADIQKKYHQFATILRKHNVSGRENAFDKLVNLFLCKIVDEKENPTNLKFYWRGMAYDTHFDLQDRLQQLYQQGMELSLNEKVTYINDKTIEDAFVFFKDDPDATKETIKRYFNQLKYFTNNDFALIDVHNEKLFYQNAVILLSIVQMLQDIRLKSDSEEHSNQFLGDMFEGFLDAGVKQSEGQFFTPMPIVKFIMASLPLEQLIAESEQPPKAIDYACGAGHFLTELARQLKPLVEKYKKAEIKDYYSQITGLEKEYRLSKVAKVSAFMYGQDEINIIYTDALSRNAGLQDGTFNLLVANPPYSVKGFLETLTMPDKKSFELYGVIDSKSVVTNNAIETFFIERAKQLLAPDGVAAIILPSSILSNDARLYQAAREVLLKHFHIIAIAELGSGTFGKTGTNTVTLFLRRRKADPDEATHYRNRVRSWIENGELKPKEKKNVLYGDLYLLEAYCKRINIAFTDYTALWMDGVPDEAVQQSELWQEYSKAFYARTDVKNHQKKPVFKRQTEEAQQDELNTWLLRHVREIETEKLYYFLLAHSNAVPVLVIKSPADNKAMKKFLGYEWSAAKGSEGIKYLNAPVTQDADDDEPTLITAQLAAIQTPLYNPSEKDDVAKLNHYIQQNFSGQSFVVPDDLKEFAAMTRLEDMLDFSRKDFNRAISLTTKKVVDVVSKWELKKLADLCSLLQRGKSTTYGDSNIQVIKSGQARGGKKFDFSQPQYAVTGFKPDERSLKKGDILINSTGVGTAGRVTYFDLEGDFVADNHITIFRSNGLVTPEYVLYYYENYIGFKTLESLAQGISGQVELSLKQIENFKIPVPPKNVQATIVEECGVIDKTINEAKQKIEACDKEIKKKLAEILHQSGEVRFDEIASLEYGKSLKESDRLSGQFPVMGSNGIVGYHNQALINGPSIIIGRKGSAGAVVYIEEDSYPIDTTFFVSYDRTKIDLKFLYHLLLTLDLPALARGKGIGVPGLNRNNVHNLKIPCPHIDIQQKLVSEIELLEAQIATAQNTIDNAPAQKRAILKKWLE